MTIKNRKGSVTVFLMVFFMSVVLCLQIFINQSEKVVIRGNGESTGSLMIQSVLAEYDLHLRERYGIFGFKGPGEEVCRKCNFYAEEAFKKKKHIHYEGSSCNLDAYSLCNTDLFRKQIIEEGKKAAAEKIKESEKENVQSEVTEGYIKNESILYYLPSKGTKKKLPLVSLGKKIMEKGTLKDAVTESGNRAFIHSYIKKYFKNARNNSSIGETLFSYEQEYLICGKYEDSANRKGIRNRITGLREISNYTCLKGDPEKGAMITAAAELITPGPGAVATAEALYTSWAFAESVNDYKLLMEGHRVPAVKTPDMWATDLQSVINNKEEDCIFTGKEKGETYEDYITLFLTAADEELLLLRIMDLIQINMKLLFYDDFMMEDYYGGAYISFSVNGEKYEMEKEY